MKNVFIKSVATISKIFLSVSLFCNSLYGITINDQPLEPGQSVSISFADKDDCTFFEIENGNITTKGAHISYITNLQEIYQEIRNQKCGSWKSKTSNISAGVFRGGGYYAATERMDIRVNISGDFIHCLIESPKISITGNQMNFKDCFLINPKELYIFPVSAESEITAMRITFNENATHPTLISGPLNLSKKEATGSLLFTNVSNITIQLSKKTSNN